jgi:hypothetical protein
MRTVSGAQARKNGCNLLITDDLVWWRRGASEYLEVLKTRNLLIFRDAKNAAHGKIAPNWNVSGTRDFQPAVQFCEDFSDRHVIRPSYFRLPSQLPRCAFAGTNRTGELITSGLPVTWARFHEAPVKRLCRGHLDE